MSLFHFAWHCDVVRVELKCFTLTFITFWKSIYIRLVFVGFSCKYNKLPGLEIPHIRGIALNMNYPMTICFNIIFIACETLIIFKVAWWHQSKHLSLITYFHFWFCSPKFKYLIDYLLRQQTSWCLNISKFSAILNLKKLMPPLIHIKEQ